jgi:acetylglutamate kinase
MKLVLRVSPVAAHHREHGEMFARAVADLIHDGHFVTVIHGQSSSVQHFAPVHINGVGNRNQHSACSDSTVTLDRENRAIVEFLAEAHVPGIGLHATDAGLVQLRKQYFGKNQAEFKVEAARLHSRWLEIICGNKGVPVLSNLASWLGGENCLIDPDHMAALCAADWDADALIYLTEESGVRSEEGGIVRWLDLGSKDSLKTAILSEGMRRCLDACAIALRRGVRRIRILPLCNVDCLSSFYFSSTSYGTEVIFAAPRTCGEL